MQQNGAVQGPIRKTREARDEPGHAHFLTYSCHDRFGL
jgi:hypothetical protein